MTALSGLPIYMDLAHIIGLSKSTDRHLGVRNGSQGWTGNVPAGYQQLRVLKDALACLPAGVEKVRLRSDTAGYQHNLLKY